MASKKLEAPEGFVFSEDVREELGMRRSVWGQRLRNNGIPVFGHPRDNRVRMIREEDAIRMTTPQPARQGSRKPSMVAA